MAVSCALLSPTLLAEEETKPSSVYDLTLKELLSVQVFSLATGTEKTLASTPSVASVITAEDIKLLGATTLAQVLDTIPGVHVSLSNELYSPKFIIRGITTQTNAQTLVLVDGTPISSVVRGDRQIVWGSFATAAIARIEIIRGPGSALHGADAFAGVINIITKGFNDIDKPQIGGYWGSFNNSSVWAQSGYQSGDLKMALSAQYTTTDGHRKIIDWDEQSNIDAGGVALGLDVPSASLAPGPVNVGYRGVDLRVNLNYLDFNLKVGFVDHDNVGTGMGGARALDPHGKTGSEKLLINLDHQHSLSQHWKMKNQYSLYRSNQRIEEHILLFPRGAFYGAFPDGFVGSPETFEQNEILQSTFTYAGLNNHRITLGGGYRVEDLYRVEETKNFNPDFSPIGHIIDASDTPEVFMPEYRRDSYFVYIQDEYKIAADWEFTGGVRIDDYSDFGSTINPRLALVWSTNNDLTTKFLYGRAFRKPSFLQLNTVNNPISLGNPNVKPETIDTLEAVFNYQLNPHLHLSLNTYRFVLDKLIDFQADVDAPTRTAQNGDGINGYGVEMQVNYQPNGQLRFTGNYAYQTATEQQTDVKQSNAPNQQWFGQLIWKISDAFKLSTQITHVGKTRRNPFDNRAPLSAYTNVGFTLNIEDVFAGFDVQLKADNIFNDDIRAPSPGPSADNPTVSVPGDYPQAGRAINLSLSKTF